MAGGTNNNTFVFAREIDGDIFFRQFNNRMLAYDWIAVRTRSGAADEMIEASRPLKPARFNPSYPFSI
jgi:hypothetical protein